MAIKNGSSLNDSITPINSKPGFWTGTGINSADIVYGLDGNDTINYSTSLVDNDLFGGNGNDIITGGSGNDYLDGGDGADTLNGGAGSDDLVGGIGVDSLNGGDGDDNLNGGADSDTLTGGNGNDNFIVSDASMDTVKDLGVGQDNVYVGSGATANATVVGNWAATTQTANYSGTANLKSAGFNVDLTKARGSDGFNVTLTGATGATVIGSKNADSLIGGGGADTISGGDSNDLITGGAGNDTLYGDAGNDQIDGGTGTDTLHGGAGDDTFIVDNIGDVVSENAGEGTDLVQSKVSYTLSAEVENLTLTGTGAINGTGNSGNNVIIGNSGNNILNGGAGADSLSGGLGNDTYVVDDAGDQVTELAGQGTDLVQSSIDFNLASTPDVENLTLTGSAVFGTGNALNNVILGNTANNTLDGGAGADTMKGGVGDDNYYVDDSGDVVSELSAQGNDTVFSSVTFTLGANVENLILTGTAAINGTGNTVSNYLWGNSGNNVLNGGTGADTMIGDGGDDTYYVDNAGDVVTEAPGQGTDSVISKVSHVLTANVENLTLTGTGAINGTGNTANNVITGNTGNNILDGGAGADTLTGGLGNDTYVIDNAGDQVVELAAEGTDLVKSDSVSIDLTNASMFTSLGNVENITLTGSANLNATGDAGINTILGNDGNNVITGGAGADVLKGGLGNDTYVVNVTAAGALEDAITETTTGGIDGVQLVGSSTNATAVTLVVASTIENFDISGTGSSLLNVTGTTSGNTLLGNDADNTLKGMAGYDTIDGGDGNDLIVGGAGNDVLTGGNGNDIFWFDTAANASTNVDTINDFVSGSDMLQFSQSLFAGIGTAGNPMNAGAFVLGTAAGDSNDRLIYDQSSGNLWFDKDGSAATNSPILLANLGAGTALNAADIWVA